MQVHSVAVPCVTLFVCQSPQGAGRGWGCPEGGGVSACTVPSVMLDLSLARCMNLHGAARLQNMMGGRDSLALLLLKDESKGVVADGLLALTSHFTGCIL